MPMLGIKDRDDSSMSQKKNYPFVFNSDDFYVGMTRENASKLESNIWINYPKMFDRIDGGDGVLSSKELETAAYEDKRNGKKIAAGGLFLSGLFLGLKAFSKKDPIAALLFTMMPKAVIAGGAVVSGLCTLYGIVTAVKAHKVAKQYEN